MSSEARKNIGRLGKAGYIAKGIAYGLVGGLLTYATVTLDRQRTGLHGAMETLREQAFGTWLLTAVAVGFIAFGVFAVLESRYRRM